MTEDTAKTRPVPTNSGNPRVAVAFPFSKIEIRDPEPALAELAIMVRDLAEHVAALSRAVSPDQADAANRLVERSGLLADSLL